MTSANGDPDGEDMMAAAFRLPSPGFGNQCNKVRRKEGSGQGWLVKTQVCLFKTDKLTQVRTLRHPETSTLSELPFHGGFYPVSTPITTIRHR